MSERRQMWGLYNYDTKKWVECLSQPGRKYRYHSVGEAKDAANSHSYFVPRPFYVKKVKQQKTLPAEVQAVINLALIVRRCGERASCWREFCQTVDRYASLKG